MLWISLIKILAIHDIIRLVIILGAIWTFELQKVCIKLNQSLSFLKFSPPSIIIEISSKNVNKLPQQLPSINCLLIENQVLY